MIAFSAVAGIVRRDLRRAARQPSRLIGGLARPFVWLLLVASGYNAIANPGTGGSYREFVFPGVIIMGDGRVTCILDAQRLVDPLPSHASVPN